MLELMAAGAVGLFVGVVATAGFAARWYAWKDDEASGDPEAAEKAYALGYQVGRLDGQIDISRQRREPETLIEPNAPRPFSPPPWLA